MQTGRDPALRSRSHSSGLVHLLIFSIVGRFEILRGSEPRMSAGRSGRMTPCGRHTPAPARATDPLIGQHQAQYVIEGLSESLCYGRPMVSMSFGSTHWVTTPHAPVQSKALLHSRASFRPGIDCKKQVPRGPSCEHLQLTASTTNLNFFFLAYVLPSSPFTICQFELKRTTFPRILTPDMFRVEACICAAGRRPLFLVRPCWATAVLHAARSNSMVMSNLFMWLSFRLSGKIENLLIKPASRFKSGTACRWFSHARSLKCARSNLSQVAAPPRDYLMVVDKIGLETMAS